MTFTVQKRLGRGWVVRNDYGLQREWGPFLTRRGAVRMARKLKKRAATPVVKV